MRGAGYREAAAESNCPYTVLRKDISMTNSQEPGNGTEAAINWEDLRQRMAASDVKVVNRTMMAVAPLHPPVRPRSNVFDGIEPVRGDSYEYVPTSRS